VSSLVCTESVLPAVLDVQEAVFVLVLGVQVRHVRSVRRDTVADEQEDSLLGLQHHALPHHEHKLSNSQIRRYEKLVLVEIRDIAALYFLANHGQAVGVPLADLVQNKFLVPSDLTVGQFVLVVRKRVLLEPEKAIFLFIGDAVPPNGAHMSDLYAKHKDEDGFLYVKYSGENTFGSA